jgi:AraC-like DNA-binding protein
VIRYREIPPSPPLRDFVNSFWILELDGEDRAPQRVVPDGHAELILNWRDPFEWLQDGVWRRQPQCFLVGQIDGPLMLRPRGPSKMLGVGFHPHGAARILAQPMHELRGRFTTVENLWPKLSCTFQAALESSDPIEAVESILLSVANNLRGRDLLVEEASRRIALAQGGVDLAAMARDLGISTRQLERRFQTTVGLPPKVFARIQRFNNVFRVLGEGERNWVEAAVGCGYYDQAHLIRDCKDLSGNTPAALLAQDADLARHFYRRFGMSHSSNTAMHVTG